MKLVAWVLIIVGLVLSIVSAVTAYSPKTTLADERLRTSAGAPLTLGAAAGKQVVDGKPQALAKSGETLTPELLAQLRAAGQNRVRVKEFAFARWSEWWVFALGCLGMFAGAMMMRVASASQVEPGAKGLAEPGGGADSELQALRAELAELRKELSATADPGLRIQLIVDRAERMTAAHVPPFIAARPQLVARLGLAGYAQLMDRFAAAERQLNRAWSAAADGYLDEATECLDNASVLLEEAEQRMK
jgi:hypothetical protein